MKTFHAVIEIIGINPFVSLPETILNYLFIKSGKNKGSIPVMLKIGGQIFSQTLVRYNNAWRLYINTPMLKEAGKKVGDSMNIHIEFDPLERLTAMHPKLEAALEKNPDAQKIFDNLSASLQKEIKRYINNLKSEAAIERNVEKAIGFLTGNVRFIGRDGLGKS